MKKTPAKDMIQKIKQKQNAEKKSNYTFRLSDSLMEIFKTRCEKGDVTMTSVVEEYIKEFVAIA